MSNERNSQNLLAKSGSPLSVALVASVQAEEAIIEQIVISIKSGKTTAVMKAARELAALREPQQAENCAE